MDKKRTFKQYLDEQAEMDAKFKAEKQGREEIVENLKKEGKIKEAAAVFSYEGFSFLVDTMGDLIVKKVEPMIDRKINEVFEGMLEGLMQAAVDNAQSKIEKTIEDSLKDFGTSDNALNEEEQEIEDGPKNEENPYINPHMHLDNNLPLLEVEQNKPEVKEKIKKEVKKDVDDLPTMTYTGYEIPRSGKGIAWSKVKDEEHMKQIVIFYLGLADEEGIELTATKFKKQYREGNGIYQRIKRSGFSFDELVQEYISKYKAPQEV